MSIAIVDYGVGNIKSIQHCLNRFGLSHEYTSDYNKILNSEKVIFPGVGDAAYAMNKLKSKGLDKVIICLLYTSPSPRDMRRSRMPSSA